MIVLGLTGSIGMGKSTTAQMFRDEGVPVHDADACVHALYEGKAVPVVEALFPGTTKNGAVDRAKLAQAVLGNSDAIKKLEAAIHPMVQAEKLAFIRRAQANNEPLVVLDIPLLFETGGDKQVDGIVVVTASAEEQRRRVLERPDMTEDKLESILKRQTPDSEKRARADFIIDTELGLEHARQRVREIVRAVQSGDWEAADHSVEN